ncbi:peptide-methionine (R)-S-oxide reductase MsrB [Tepidamorphus sp. 3E244]|uniref:peptide-methionine (R)-S-oxide reductase MsrB n=1 Tax=Tepidamorphus sp. 3E244 TaxID=3385498 RepID=UPI0038FCDE05
MTNRRAFLLSGAAVGALAAAGGLLYWRQSGDVRDASFEISRSEDEWRAMLSEDEYAVLREEATERPFSSPLNDETRDGTFTCAGCGLDVYSSQAKFNSGTGWPSFYESLQDAVETKADRSLLVERTEVHCRRCGGHFGHIFDDGPPPTGKRHCLNGVALDFRPRDA